MIRLCRIGPDILRALYDPHGLGAGGPIVARRGHSGERQE